MEEFETALNKLGFTRYEAQALIAIIKFKSLDAPGITQNSGVPQPKVYETMEKLVSWGLVDKVPIGRKGIYQVKPKSIVEKRIGMILQEFSSTGQLALTSIDSTYDTGQGIEIPFVGIAGTENIIEYLSVAIEDARESVSLFLPSYLVQGAVIASLNAASQKIQVEIICRDETNAMELAEQLPNASIYVLSSPAFDVVHQIGEMIKSFLPDEQRTSFSFGIIEKVLDNAAETFGISAFDQQKSFFLIPLHVGVPSAIITTLPEMLKFHLEGIHQILKSSKQIQ
jgi:sugar-specific transcriptional regulator TrmB